MGQDVKLQSLQLLFRAHGGVWSSIVVENDVRLRSAASLVANVRFQVIEGMDVTFCVDGGAFA